MIKKKNYVSDNPILLSEWDYERNKGITPEKVSAYSNKKYYWRCKEGHSWMAKPANRSNGNDCPYCSGKLPIVGKTDLASVNPQLALQWDYERNKGVTPEMVMAYSNKKYYWRCKEGHSWMAKPANRTNGNDCPYCSGKLPIVGKTDLVSVNPQLAAEWDYKRNKGVTPEMVTAYSNKKYYWRCKEEHSWMATVNSRTRGNGCPYCSGRLPIVGKTDLASVNPELALEWDYERNKGITSEMVTAYSNKKYFWKCKKGHSWMASPANRSNGKGCPYCK